ncbi:MAG: hypothetical protein Q9M97_08140 [Candidatus Gracilibacteria bacterium]|nr:hypothetical protein [Candidatus Gracilibacteria bacterium]
MEKNVKELKTTVNRIDNSNIEIKEEMNSGFKYVNDSINQAFEKISENMEYQEKVDTVIDLLKRNRNFSKLKTYS